MQAGLLLQPLHPTLDQLLQSAACPALAVLLTSLTLSLSLQEVKATPSSKVMLSWLKNSQEGSPQKKENDLPRWTSQFIHSPSPKKTSADILQQWLGKEGEPAAKKRKA